MNNALKLQKIELMVPASATVLAAAGLSEYSIRDIHPLMSLTIDFKEGKLKLAGNWQYLVSMNKCSDKQNMSCHRQQVKFDTDIYPVLSPNLNDDATNGIVMTLDGSIIDENIISSCSGLLWLDGISLPDAHPRWNITVYLYDLQYNEAEIKLSVPVLMSMFEPNGKAVLQ